MHMYIFSLANYICLILKSISNIYWSNYVETDIY